MAPDPMMRAELTTPIRITWELGGLGGPKHDTGAVLWASSLSSLCLRTPGIKMLAASLLFGKDLQVCSLDPEDPGLALAAGGGQTKTHAVRARVTKNTFEPRPWPNHRGAKA